jgi:hypothetical protein
MSSTKSVREINQELARRINEEALANPQSPYAGKFVGFANGQVVVVTEDLDELAAALEVASPNPAETYFIEAGRDHSQVEEIWRAD